MMRLADVLATAARALDGVGEGVACAGTAVEAKTYSVSGKTFLFLGSKDARLKLMQSVDEARTLSRAPDSVVRVGAGGWTTLLLTRGAAPSDAVLRRWVAESCMLFRKPTAGVAERRTPASEGIQSPSRQRRRRADRPK